MSTVQEAVNHQRAKIQFCPRKMAQFLYGKEQYAKLKSTLDKYDVIPYDFNIFNKGRVQVIKQAIRDMPKLFNYTTTDMSDENFIYLVLSSMHQMPGTPHSAMFMRCIQFMGTEQQKKQFLLKCERYEIIGGYVQTELGHGSDVSSLMTTATYDAQKDSFILQTPCTSSIKFWPGQIGLYGNHALVFAQLIVNGKNHGVQAFIVPIRDENMKPLQNIEVGDIGPKMGYISRDNGYLQLKKVSVPRKNMLSRFISIQNGKVKTTGNPKVAYATMMQIRKHLCTSSPKIYSSAITIATKYSLFRKQFKNDKKEQIKIMDYQLQQQKIIQRIAQYFAITLAGNKVNKISTQNAKLVRQKQDFSLMEQAHFCLSACKSFFTEIVFDGMEICRKACGGHGFSQYSGFPSLIFEFAPNMTQQGQNTVLYLQVARHLMKGYKGLIVNNKPVKGSIKYIENHNKLLTHKCNVQGPENWKMQDIQTILAQAVCYMLTVASQKIVTKPQDMGQKQLLNKVAGINLKDLAVMHCAYFCFSSLRQAVDKQIDPKIKAVTQSLCLLFGANFLVTRGIPAIQGGFISRQQIRSLNDLKQILLSKIRPDVIGIIDGFGIPDKYVRSALTYGNPYQNFLKLARECDVNHSRLRSAEVVKTVKNHLKNPDAKL